MLYAIFAENCAYDMPIYASTSFGKDIPKPEMQRRRAGSEADSPKKIKARPIRARRRRKISNSGAFAGIKKYIIYIIMPLIKKLFELYAGESSLYFEIRKKEQRKKTVSYTHLRAHETRHDLV